MEVWLDEKDNAIFIKVPDYKLEDEIHDVYIKMFEDGEMWQQGCVSPEDPRYGKIPPASQCSDYIDINIQDLFRLLREWLEQ